MWQCAEKHAKRQFSVKVGTIIEDSPIGLDKWLPAMWLIANAKNGISTYELARVDRRHPEDRMVHAPPHPARDAGRNRRQDRRRRRSGRNLHRRQGAQHAQRAGSAARHQAAAGGTGKVAVHGLAGAPRQDGHSTRAHVVVPNNRASARLQAERSRRTSTEGSHRLHRCAARRTNRPGAPTYVHEVIDHAEAYVDGQVHTNGLENFWSLLKRALKGTYVSRRTVPSVPLPRRAGLPFQQPQAD